MMVIGSRSPIIPLYLISHTCTLIVRRLRARRYIENAVLKLSHLKRDEVPKYGRRGTRNQKDSYRSSFADLN